MKGILSIIGVVFLIIILFFIIKVGIKIALSLTVIAIVVGAIYYIFKDKKKTDE